jgi:hypothetical protein
MRIGGVLEAYWRRIGGVLEAYRKRIRGVFGACSGRIRCVFAAYSGRIRGVFGAYSGHNSGRIRGVFGACSWRIRGPWSLPRTRPLRSEGVPFGTFHGSLMAIVKRMRIHQFLWSLTYGYPGLAPGAEPPAPGQNTRNYGYVRLRKNW